MAQTMQKYRVYYSDGSIQDFEVMNFEDLSELVDQKKLVIKVSIFIKDKVY